jgi:hypothetical protein
LYLACSDSYCKARKTKNWLLSLIESCVEAL